MEKLYTSCNLCSIPFISSTDSTRLQMSSKQLNQAITHPNCQVPKVIGSNYRYLSHNSNLYKAVAEYDGCVTFSEDTTMSIVYYSGNPKTSVQTFNTPPILQCTSYYSTRLWYRRPLGDFKAGQVLYEYDSFKNNIPVFGYNLWTAYMPFFGLVY